MDLLENKELTFKQRKFIKELTVTLHPTEAAMRAYNCKDRLSARVIASENLTKLNISMSELMDKMGLDTQQDVEDLKKLRKTKDNHIKLKALELTLKLKGYLKQKDVSVEKHVHLTAEKRKEILDNLKKSFERGLF